MNEWKRIMWATPRITVEGDSLLVYAIDDAIMKAAATDVLNHLLIPTPPTIGRELK